MKKLMLFGGFVLAICSGCVTVQKPVPPPPPPAPTLVEVQVPHPGPVTVSVVSGEGVLTPALAGLLENGLAGRGLRVGSKSNPDVQVQLSTTWRELERLNDWAAWEGAATVRATHEAIGGALLGSRTFVVKSKRGTDEPAAQRQVVATLKETLEPWLATTVTPKLQKRMVTEQRPVPPAK